MFTNVYPFRGGVSKILPVRSTVLALPQNWIPITTSPRAQKLDSTPATTFLPGGSDAPLFPIFRTHERSTLLQLRSLKELLEITVFRENIAQRLCPQRRRQMPG